MLAINSINLNSPAKNVQNLQFGNANSTCSPRQSSPSCDTLVVAKQEHNTLRQKYNLLLRLVAERNVSLRGKK